MTASLPNIWEDFGETTEGPSSSRKSSGLRHEPELGTAGESILSELQDFKGVNLKMNRASHEKTCVCV